MKPLASQFLRAEPETHPDLVEAPAAEAESGDEPTHIADIEHEDDDKGGDDDRMAGLVDNSKAWDMAHAAKPERDHAAKLRALNKIDTELLPEVEDFFENYDTIPADQRPRIQEELLERIRPVVAANRSGNMHLMDADLELSFSNKTGTHMRGDRARRENEYAGVQGMRAETARTQDEFADRAEDLAGILHEHPISDRYKETHKGIELSASGLTVLERAADKKLAEVAKFEEKLDGKSVRELLKHGMPIPHQANAKLDAWTAEWLAERVKEVDEDAAAEMTYEYLKMTKEPENVTLAQYVSFFREGAKKACVYAERTLALASKSVVEDVVSGRASEAA